MHPRRTVLALLLGAAIPLRLRADMANGDARLHKLFGQFIAPCCWQENLLVHHSPKADELRAEIKQQIAAGKTDQQIKTAFVSQYSLRVLSMPEGARAQWLSWTPVAIAAAGLAMVAVFIKRSVRPTPAATAPTALPDIPDFD
jgi:cytochrome c-type biogenesis protein CcmH/NrfF